MLRVIELLELSLPSRLRTISLDPIISDDIGISSGNKAVGGKWQTQGVNTAVVHCIDLPSPISFPLTE